MADIDFPSNSGDPHGERQFHRLAESIPHLVWASRPDGDCNYHNHRRLDYTGLTPEESWGRGWMAAVHPDDLQRCRSAWSEALETCEPFECEYRLRRADGVYRWFLARAEPSRDDKGRVVRWFGTDTDIDDRRRSEERLHESDAALRSFYNSSPLLMGVVELVGDDVLHVYNNPATNRFLGREPDDPAGYRASETAAPPRTIALWVKHYRRSQALGTPARFEYEHEQEAPATSRRLAVTVAYIGTGNSGRPRWSFVAEDVTDRTRWRDETRESEERFRAIFDNAAVGMGQLGLDGRWLRVNDRLCSILGESREELLAGAHQDVTSPDDLRDELGPLRRLVAGEINTFAFRKRYDHKGGVSVWANLTLSLLRDDQARPESCIAIGEDVTEQMRAEDGLRESERRRLVAMEIGQVFTFEWDLRTDAIKVSPNAPALLGRDAWFSGSHEFFEAIHPDDRDRFRVTLRSLAPGDEEYRTEYRLRMPDGSWTWLEDYARGEFSEEGLVGVHGLTRNISTRKQSEEHIARLNAELKMSLRAFQVVLDTAPVGIHVARDPQCKVITSNRAFDEILGTHRGENVSKSRDDPDSLPFRLFQEGREAGPDELPMQKALARGVPIDDELYDVERADGKRLKLIICANPIRDASGAVVGGVAVGVDVTALKNAEQALKEADQRKDEFLAMLGHELRNPLAGISNALQLIRAPGVTNEDLAWAYDVTERQMQNLVRLIDDLLDVSRITTGKVRLRRERVDAAAVVARAVTSARPFIESRRHELSVTVADVPMPMEGDPTRLEQIIANLLNNAAKYTDEGGHIRLTAEVEGDEAVIRVRDDGVGIAPETLPTLFELFAQADSSIDRARGGLGIGLTLARTLTAMHGGRVSGSSEGAGRGSEFTVRLPLLRARDGNGDGDGGAARDSARAPGRSGPRRVLIVDDNLDTLQGMATLLKLSGHEVVTALDGVSAVATALEQRPEFILLDIGLPGMSGYEVAETLRREGMTDAVLIAVSGYARENDRLRSRQAGFDHHLGKPVELEVVLALLARTR